MKHAWLCGLVVLMASAASPSALAGPAADRDAPFNVDCEIGWRGCYRPLRWTPVEIGIARPMKEPFEGSVTLVGQQDESSRMTIVRDFVLTPDVPLRLPLVTRFTFGIPECTVTIRDSKGRPAWQKTYELWDLSKQRQVMTAVGAADLLVVVSGREKPDLGRLEETTRNRGHAPTGGGWGGPWSPPPTPQAKDEPVLGKVYVRQRLLRTLPHDWTAYDAVDLLVLYDPDWTTMLGTQSEAIVRWVESGGRLLVVMGSRPMPEGHPIARLLGLRIGDARSVRLPRETLQGWGLGDLGGAAATLWQAEEPDAFGWTSRTLGTGEVLSASGPVGFGRAGVVLFDPAALGAEGGDRAARFWADALNSVLGTSSVELGKPDEDASGAGAMYYQYALEQSAAASNAVLDHLMDIRELEPISIVWVVLLLAGLAVVIGPVDYLVLKRRGRLPLTHLTFTLYIGVFSVVAYFGVLALRSGPPRLRAVSVADAVQGRPGGWMCRYSGIYASESGDYPLMNVGREEWWSLAAPASGPWVSAGQQAAARRMTCAQGDGGSMPLELPISIWVMQCLAAEAPVEGVPIAAQVEVDGAKVKAVVENLSARPVSRGYILMGGDRLVRFGPIGPGERLPVAGVAVVGSKWDKDIEAYSQSWYNGGPRTEFAPEVALFAAGNSRRTEAVGAYLAQGAVAVVAFYKDAPLALCLGDPSARGAPPGRMRPRTGQVIEHEQIVRLVVLPAKSILRSRGGAAAATENGGSAP